jgi:hypothetical protein
MRKLTFVTLASFFLTAFAAVGTGGCDGLGATRGEDSELRYGTFTPGRETLRQWSAFTTIAERYGCQLPVILYAASGAIVTPEQARFTRAAITKAVVAWTSALEDNDYWPCKQRVTVNHLMDAGQLGMGTVQVYIDAAVSRSYAVVGANPQIYLSPQYTNAYDPYAERVILHEFGHMMGLADTYTEPGYQQPIGQPAGIMNQLYEVAWLTPDDYSGAEALYDFINGRGQFCEDDYAIGGAYENKNAVAFCVPVRSPLVGD